MAEVDTRQGDDARHAGDDDVAADFEKMLAGGSDVRYILHLYVTGVRPSSQRTIENIRHLCEEYLKGRYELEIIDIYQQPALAAGAQIIAAPTLVKELPPPLRRFIGDLSDEDRMLVGLGIEASPHPEAR